MERWIASGTVLSMASDRCEIEDAVLSAIETVGLAIEPTPAFGDAQLRP